MADFNVVILNDFAHINGGASQVALSTAIGLAQNSYEVTLFSAVEPIMPELLDNGVQVISTNQHEILKDSIRSRAAIQGIWNIKAARLFDELLSRFDKSNTVIHLHSWSKALSSSVVRVAVHKGFKIVCTLHDYFTACPNGAFYNYKEQTMCTLKPLSLQCFFSNCDMRSYTHKLWRFARQAIQRDLGLIPSGIRYFIYVSEYSYKILESYLPQDVVSSTISSPIERKNKVQVDVANNAVYVAVGRLSLEKGVLLFAEAAKRSDVPTFFVGDGECREQIHAIYPGATITGWLPHNKINDYLSQARMLVFPSLLHETYGLVVLEAASRGVPSIVADTSAASSLVANKVTGLLFEGGNLLDLINKIAMSKDDVLVSQLGIAAYNRYWKNPFTMEKYLASLQEVYRKMLGHN